MNHQEHQEVCKAVDPVGGAIVDSRSSRDLRVDRQASLPIVYRVVQLDAEYRHDLLVENVVTVELKCVDAVTPVHAAQVLTDLRLSGHSLACLCDFNVALVKNGVRRFAV